MSAWLYHSLESSGTKIEKIEGSVTFFYPLPEAKNVDNNNSVGLIMFPYVDVRHAP